MIAAIAASWLTGHQQADLQARNLTAQANLQERNLTAQTTRSDKVELRAVVDAAESTLLRGAGVGEPDPLHVSKKDPFEAKFADIQAMRLPEARLTVRLGADHPITRAYRLARHALASQLACDGVAPGDLARARLVEQAIDQFNDSVTDLLGSAVVQRRRHDDASLIRRRLDRLEKVLERPNFNCF